MSPGRYLRTVLGCFLLLPTPGPTSRGDEPPRADAAATEFFERSVRPILAERCLGCHGPEKQKGELRLDSRAAALAGGATGPAVTPGDADGSLLVSAIRYGGEIQMPPKSKLDQEEIEVLTRWVASGAAWPGEPQEVPSIPKAGLGGSPEFDRRAKFWSFRPIREVVPPGEIEGARAGWPRNAIDRFLLAGMSRRGLEPSGEADRRTLIRRLTFDLTGLPPTPGEVAEYLADGRPDAYERVVDRLLASPRYGERSARLWLDLVRFAETAGHEFDYDILNAWRYRDYVVKAFNIDLTYDRFVVEHLAGDLLPSPRTNTADGSNESIQGTGFFWLGEGVHSPLDVRDEGVRRVDNQIDVLSKTFLGLTVSCARCHDHKFDPITQDDYYALAGFLRSTRHQQAFIEPVTRTASLVAELEIRKAALAAMLQEAGARLGAPQQDELHSLFRHVDVEPRKGGPAPVDLQGWRASGDAFAAATRTGGFRIDARTGRLVAVSQGTLHSGRISDRLQGVVRSPTFTIEKRWLHLLAAGSGGRINVIIDGFEKVRDPIYGGLTTAVNSPGGPRWIARDLAAWVGHRAYLEACDGASAEFTGAVTKVVDGNGWMEVVAVRTSDDASPPFPAPPPSVSVDVDGLIRTVDGVDSPLAARISTALAEYRSCESRLPEPALAPAAIDGDGEDEIVMLRGNPRTPGPLAPRRFLAVLGGAPPGSSSSGSGRLELARAMVDVGHNPLTPRVMANRIWKQHFGEGLVRSTDDFGAMGQEPSNPELLEWLAAEFVRGGWSFKAMRRLIVGSSAYRMSSQGTSDADRIDPTNALVHRMNVRRLEAEAVRDALLAVSGMLDERPGGPSVPPFLSPFMDGRGRPATSGPLEGYGRRSLYLQVRRNFLNPFLQAFDAPVPFSTMGRRHASNVPAQALTLLNDPLVLRLADAWADRIMADDVGSDAGRIGLMYSTAFGRPPRPDELARCTAYLEACRSAGPSASREAWTNLAHALFNVKEFIYVD